MRITFEVTKKHLRRNNKEPLCPVERALEEIGFNGAFVGVDITSIILNDKCFIANNTSKLKTFIDAIDSSGYSSKRPPPTKFRLDFKPELDSGPYQRY